MKRHAVGALKCFPIYMSDSYFHLFFNVSSQFHTVRFAKSSIFETQLAGYIQSFADHRKNIQFEISVFTKKALDTANQSLVYLTQMTENINASVLALFRMLDTEQEKTVRKYVDENDGPDECLKDDEKLKKIMSMTATKTFTMVTGPRESSEIVKTHREKAELTMIRDQYKQGLNEAFEENMKQFLGVLSVLEKNQKQLKDDLTDVIKSQSHLVIEAVNSGPFVRILDPVRCRYALSKVLCSVVILSINI
jgi:Na+/phosphate symporter